MLEGMGFAFPSSASVLFQSIRARAYRAYLEKLGSARLRHNTPLKVTGVVYRGALHVVYKSSVQVCALPAKNNALILPSDGITLKSGKPLLKPLFNRKWMLHCCKLVYEANEAEPKFGFRPCLKIIFSKYSTQVFSFPLLRKQFS